MLELELELGLELELELWLGLELKLELELGLELKLDLELELGQPSIAIDSNMVISVSTGSSRW